MAGLLRTKMDLCDCAHHLSNQKVQHLRIASAFVEERLAHSRGNELT